MIVHVHMWTHFIFLKYPQICWPLCSFHLFVGPVSSSTALQHSFICWTTLIAAYTYWFAAGFAVPIYLLAHFAVPTDYLAHLFVELLAVPSYLLARFEFKQNLAVQLKKLSIYKIESCPVRNWNLAFAIKLFQIVSLFL